MAAAAELGAVTQAVHVGPALHIDHSAQTRLDAAFLPPLVLQEEVTEQHTRTGWPSPPISRAASALPRHSEICSPALWG